jgi:hypothetical protein
VEHFAPVDVSHVARESDILKNCLFWFVPWTRTGPDVKSREELATLVTRLGGGVRPQPTQPAVHACVDVG